METFYSLSPKVTKTYQNRYVFHYTWTRIRDVGKPLIPLGKQMVSCPGAEKYTFHHLHYNTGRSEIRIIICKSTR